MIHGLVIRFDPLVGTGADFDGAVVRSRRRERTRPRHGCRPRRRTVIHGLVIRFDPLVTTSAHFEGDIDNRPSLDGIVAALDRANKDRDGAP